MKNKLVYGLAFCINLLFLISLILFVTKGYDGPYFAIFISFLLAAYHVDVRFIFGFLGIQLIRDKINIKSKAYRVSKSEYTFLSKFKMKKWKERYFAMDKSQFVLKDIRDKNAVELVLKNNINAELTHWFCIIAGAFSILIGCLISLDEWWIYVVTAFVVTIVVDALPIMIQRYNRYRLQSIYEKLCKKEEKQR